MFTDFYFDLFSHFYWFLYSIAKILRHSCELLNEFRFLQVAFHTVHMFFQRPCFWFDARIRNLVFHSLDKFYGAWATGFGKISSRAMRDDKWPNREL